VDRATAIRCAAKLGIAASLDQPFQRFRPYDVPATSQQQIVGQPTAWQAVANVVVMCRAELNDHKRLRGVWLFCGPTGVGTTELAKWLLDHNDLRQSTIHGERSQDGQVTFRAS
jgi:ATP-dependent Clp protease ATP-binding subunit ClpA